MVYEEYMYREQQHDFWRPREIVRRDGQGARVKSKVETFEFNKFFISILQSLNG